MAVEEALLPQTRVRKENAIRRYLRETQTEIRRVVWPTREEAAKLTGIVTVVTVAMSIFLGVLDFLLAKGVDQMVS